jgi:uncharacterized protein YdhG (YjbR/CyaY superfamily)
LKHIADLKAFLEERVAEIKEEIDALEEELQTYVKALEEVDVVLTKEGFKSAADMMKAPPQEEPVFKPISEAIPEKKEKIEKKEYPIKDKNGKMLGKASVSGNTISIVPEKDVKFSAQAPPFKSFFSGKIVNRMETEDDKAIKDGSLSKSEKIAVSIIKDDGDIIQNIIVQNFRKYDRMMDIINTITWTFRTLSEEQAK